MSFHYRYRKQIILSILLLIILGSLGFIGYKYLSPKKKKKVTVTTVSKESKSSNIIKKEKEQEKDKEKEKVTIDIKGEVNKPGLYSLDLGSRISDAIAQAGGLTERANVTVINLAKKLFDEMVIIIYSNYEVENFKKVKEMENSVQTLCQNPGNGLNNDACINSSTDNNTKQELGMININNATKEEIMTLPGIGESKADAIISYRKENGNFKNIEDIKNVSGIGDSLFDKIKTYITI